MDGPYELRFFADVLDWIHALAKEDPDSHDHVIAALERLQEAGPALRRPTVGAIEDSRYRNMRELRPRNGSTVSIRYDELCSSSRETRRAGGSGQPGTPRRSEKPMPSTWLTLKL
ncbi:type II toxin-antitoxin system RelE/ParE family toxin [Streptomyces sp. wa1]|uniref:type II toxin-antitoxin system RelE/ParE family toxin n=1 Tax=Streptomyces sp. wa1 TaxID=1828184 RepID=UPI003C7C23C3